jgi:uncharacterized membrane protein YphA (DoxX/SURF4 family)
MLNKLLENKLHPVGLSIFRILFSTVLLFEAIFIFNHRQLFFDPLPFIDQSPIETGLPLIIWMVVLVFLILGYKTRIAAVLNYIFILVFISSLNSFEYHIHYTYTGISFLFLFLPIGNTLSIDQKNRATSIHLVSKLHYLLPLVAGVGLVYFDSVFYKLSSDVWSKGMGMWLPASLPYVSILPANSFLNNEWVMTFLGYITFVFEVLFLFLVWFKRARVSLLIIGVGLHIGILICFPIPLFAFGVITLYILLVPISWWKRLGLNRNTEVYKPDINPRHKKLYLYMCIVLCVLQLNITLNYSLVLKPVMESIYEKLPGKTYVNKGRDNLRVFSTKFFGITTHAVFMDSHFKGYNHIIAVKYVRGANELWLPIIDKEGRPGELLSGATWVNWTWRVSSPKIDHEQLKKGLKRYVSFYAGKNNLDLKNGKFIILVKRIDVPNKFEWEEDFLEEQIKKPWSEIGTLTYLSDKKDFIIGMNEIQDE